MNDNIPHWALPTDPAREACEADAAPRFYSDAELADRDVLEAWMFEDDDECVERGRLLVDPPAEIDDTPF
jgi:hypothetical protein